MKPIEFEGCNTTFAKDQPEYLQLPAYCDEDGSIVTEWQLTDEERKRISAGENLRICILTFNKPLQPIRPYLSSLIEIDEAEDRGKKQSYVTERKCGDCYCGSKEEVYTCEKCNGKICYSCAAKRTSTNNVESNICVGCSENLNHLE